MEKVLLFKRGVSVGTVEVESKLEIAVVDAIAKAGLDADVYMYATEMVGLHLPTRAPSKSDDAPMGVSDEGEGSPQEAEVVEYHLEGIDAYGNPVEEDIDVVVDKDKEE